MRPHFVAVLLGVLFVLSALTPAAQAAPEDEEIPMLRIFFEKDEYIVGEQVNVTVELTANGRHVAPDLGGVRLVILMNFTFGGEGGPRDLQEVEMVEVDRGKFTGSFTIQPYNIVRMEPDPEGLPLMGQVVFMMAICSYFDVETTAMGVVMIEDGPAINLAVSNHNPAPGDEVTITVTTTNGSVVDAADVVVGLTSYDGEVSTDLADLTVTRESTGVYKARYTVPVDLTHATLYTVNTGASFADYNTSAYLSPLFGSGFMVNFYDVWFQNVSATDDETEVAMWIADLDGTALEGIDVDLDVDIYLKAGGMDTQALANTTGADGKAGFVISHASAERLDVRGMVTDDTLFQRFYMEAVFDQSEAEAPEPENPEDFAVEPWEEPEDGPIWDEIKEPGDPVHVKYRVFDGAIAMPNKRINWYLVDQDGFFDTNWTTLESGFEVTDGSGDFDLTFTVPGNDVNGWLMFEANVWNPDKEPDPGFERMQVSEPLIDAGFFSRDENIEISVGRVHKDNPVELRAIVPLPASYYIGQFFAVFDEDTGLSQWGQPVGLGPMMSDDFNIQPLPKMGPDLFGMDKQLPEFFPEDQSIAFMVLSVDIELFKIQMNYVMMGYGESSTKGIDVNQPNEPEPIDAGSEGTLEFEVENTGAGTDQYTLEKMTGPDWLAWENETLSVEPSETGTFTATVTVPPGINENRYYWNITVTSETDDTMTENIELWVDVMVNGVDVSIEDDEETAFREETVEFVVAIENTGQGNDTFALTLEGTAAGWATPSHSSIALQEGLTAEVVVQVVIPNDADEDTYTLNFITTSGDGVTNDSVEMAVHVLVDGVDVEAETDLDETWREVTVSLSFDVTNTGQGSDTFTFTVEGDEPDGAVLSDETLEIAEGETEVVLMEVTPPDDADAGYYDFILVATSANGVTNASAKSTVHLWVTGVHLSAQGDRMTGYRGEQLKFDFDLTNTGQERDVFTLTHEGTEWAEGILFSATPVALDPDEVGVVSATIMLSDTIDQDVYTFIVKATSQDGMSDSSNTLTVTVVVNDVEISMSTESIVITKGKEREITLTIENTGQGSDTFTILYTGEASNWSTPDKSTVTLAEGLSEDVIFTISPSKNVKGDQAFLDITVVSSDPTFNEKVQVQVVLKAPEDEDGGLSTAVIIAIVVIIIVIVGLLVYMMQSKGD